MIDIHILKKSGRLDPFLTTINEVTDKGIKEIQKLIPLDNIDIVIADSPDQTIPELGMGGHAYTKNLIEIYIDPDFSDLDKNLSHELLGTLAHELHHVARMNTVGYGTTLLEACVSEGLADHFERDITGSEPRPWDTALSTVEFDRIRLLAEKEFNQEYSHNDWFFGSAERNIPKWAGYSIGYQLVSEYLKKHPDATAAKLHNSLASNFV